MSLLTWDGVMALEDPQWLIEGVVPQGEISLLYGASGSGKTFWTLDMALCVASGRKWRGRKVRQGSVVYVAGERSQAFKTRMAAWAKQHRMSSVPGFHLWRGAVSLWRNPEAIARFTQEVCDHGIHHPALVVFDTLSTSLGGADGDKEGSHIREILDTTQKLIEQWGWDTAVLYIHHLSKTATDDVKEQAEGGTKKRKRRPTFRGPQTLGDGVAMHAYFQGDGKTWGRLECSKQGDAEPFERIEGTLHTVKLANGRQEYAFSDHYQTGPRERAKGRVSKEQVLRTLWRAAGTMSQQQMGAELGCTPKAAGNHLRALQDEGLAQAVQRGQYAVTEQGAEVAGQGEHVA